MCNLHGIDWDSALSYETSRTVKLRDWRLGSGMLALQFSIFSYVVINAVCVGLLHGTCGAGPPSRASTLAVCCACHARRWSLAASPLQVRATRVHA